MRRAAKRVVDEIAPPAADGGGRDILGEELEILSTAVVAIHRGEAASELGPGQTDRLHLLRSLRGALLWEWPGDTPLSLSLMRAFETAEETLKEDYRQLTLADVLDPFSRNLLKEVAHILRSPLGSLVMIADTLRDSMTGSLDAGQERQLRIIHRAAVSAATIAGDLLSLVGDEVRYDPSDTVSLPEITELVADVIRPVTESRSSDLVVPDIEDGRRRGAPIALAQTLLTLGLHAALLTRDGSVELVVRPDGDRVSFGVLASGAEGASTPNDPEDLSVLRTDTMTGRFSVSAHGLGVAAAREMIRRMGSDLDATATAGGELALRFELALPSMG